ncbi:MAG TPA: BadF/BadG/BcrA/BcrD ATPase family protein [Bryobacteraceae bacterium]|nr:BadF/BadG/BcrA/BcrD ATPase family protein [Bryobacteraceae bacterium]
MPQYFLGIDGGQSSTTALIGDETGRVIGAGRGGPCNHAGAAEGRAKFVAAMTACLQAACAQAGLDPSSVRFACACLGFSGGPADKEAILREILASDRMVVTTDAFIALTGATAGEPGLIVIAGTGSIAFGRNATGQTARAGGWGYLFGDEGGGFHIVRQALRAALRAEEGWGPPTALRAVLLQTTGAHDMNQLLHLFYTAEFPRDRVAGLAKLVDGAAENGDHVAREILHEAAQQLAILAAAVRRQLFGAGERVRLAHVGRVFHSRILLARFQTLVQLDEGTLVEPPLYPPAGGALLEAYRAAGAERTLSNVPAGEF